MTVDPIESEQSYRNLFANNSAAMLLIDLADDAIIDVNTAATTFYGYSREQLLTMRITDINTLPGSEVRQAMASVSQKQGQRFEFQHCLADGSLRDVEVSASSINFGGRTVLHLIIHDITERRRAEDGLRQANETLEQRVRERSLELEMFSYSVSHDLRAPLRHLIGFVQLLNKNAPEFLDEKIRHYLAVISDSATQMSMLVDGLLSFSRMGRSEMTVVRVSFDKLIHEVLNTLQAENDGRNIVWNIGPLPEVMGDPVMLQIVMMSLVSNAIKFTRNKSRAEISIACTSGNSGEHIFSVRDNGAGFDMKYYDKLFNLFKRLHRTEDFEGTGVGLANVLRIVQRHGGRSWAESEVGSGSVFYFSLPTTPQVDERS